MNDPKADRAARLKAALRDNLRKRKAQGRDGAATLAADCEDSTPAER